MRLDGLIQIGTLFNAHGIKGEVKLSPLSEDTALISNLKEVTIQKKGETTTYNVLRSRPVKTYWLMQLVDINDMDQAKALKGAEVYVDESLLSPLEENEFFIHDLMDATVFSTDGEELGVIHGYFETGAQIILEVKGKHPFIFPATDEILKEIIAEEKKVIIQIIPGLLDLNP